MKEILHFLRIWLSVWVLVSTLQAVFDTIDLGLPLLLQTLLLTAIVVPTMMYGIVPVLTRRRARGHTR